MKTRIFLIIGILLIDCNLLTSKDTETGKTKLLQSNSVNVFASPDLISLTSKWIRVYNNLNPGLKIELITAPDRDIAKLLSTGATMGFISDEVFSTMRNQTPWNLVVGRDVVVPIMNGANPFINDLARKGITTKRFELFFENPEMLTWQSLLGEPLISKDQPVHYYFVNDPSITSALKNFTGSKQLKITGIEVTSEQKLIAAVQNDPNGFGFCRLVNISDQLNKSFAANIKLVPIDKNGSGKIDYSEAIYDNLQEFSRGVWIGRYPLTLSGKIYSVASTKPRTEAELAFLKWVLTDGQLFLNDTGFSALVYSEKQSQLDKINQPSTSAKTAETSSIIKIFFIILLVIILILIVLDIVASNVRTKKKAISTAPANLLYVFTEAATCIPKGLYFDKTHTWAFMKKDGQVKIGLDDFMQHVTGPITRVEMRNTGDMIKKGDYLFSIIQKGKHLKINSPLTGTITVQNTILTTHPTLLNTAPFTDGWIYLVEPTNWLLEIRFMSMAEKYAGWLKTEYSRLKDFFETAVRIHMPAFVMILQDGGVLREGILEDLGPEVWEDFQTKFIDATR